MVDGGWWYVDENQKVTGLPRPAPAKPRVPSGWVGMRSTPGGITAPVAPRGLDLRVEPDPTEASSGCSAYSFSNPRAFRSAEAVDADFSSASVGCDDSSTPLLLVDDCTADSSEPCFGALTKSAFFGSNNVTRSPVQQTETSVSQPAYNEIHGDYFAIQ
jgi:hypothetical protein